MISSLGTVQTALTNAYWESRASTAAMTAAAMKALDMPLELERWLAVEKVIDGWLLRSNGPVRFDAMAREVVAMVERDSVTVNGIG